MASFTFMSPESIAAICEANDRRAENPLNDPGYLIRLSPAEFRNIVALLTAVYFMPRETIDQDGVQAADNIVEWSGDFIDTLAQSLDIEMI